MPSDWLEEQGLSENPPNTRIQPTPLRVGQDRADFSCYRLLMTFPTYQGGAADAQHVGPGSLRTVFCFGIAGLLSMSMSISVFPPEK